jgi:GNAT superfamily N-acetyltransferase
MKIQLAETDGEIESCFGVMKQLRTHLDGGEFLALIRQQQSEGFRLAFLEEAGVVRAVAGFRVMHMLYSGKTMYVDDLVTDETKRSSGYGEAILRWLIELARSESCDRFSLDSGTQRARAHRFYFKQGMSISSFHFQLEL